jgi:hypothetical protein
MDGGTHGLPEVLEPEGLGSLPEVPTYFGSFRSDVCLGLMGGVGHYTPEAMAPVALAVAPNSLATTTLHVRPAVAIASPCSTTTAAPTTGAPAATTPATVASATAATPTTLTAAPTAPLCVGDPEIELGKW